LKKIHQFLYFSQELRKNVTETELNYNFSGKRLDFMQSARQKVGMNCLLRAEQVA